MQGEPHIQVHPLEHRGQIGGLAVIGPAVQQQHGDGAGDPVQPVGEQRGIGPVQPYVRVPETGVQLERQTQVDGGPQQLPYQDRVREAAMRR